MTNRLIHETSPYLLQHAQNPVHWYPWCDEAFQEASKRKCPILLSIGYSTCHWCHVMEDESFEDREIALFLNDNYVAIKVDREERPDIDGIYMAAVQAMTGSGGWPMTVWLSPDKKPFYGGTYFPARDGDRGCRIGFLSILKKVVEFYHSDPLKVEVQGESLSAHVETVLAEVSKVDHLPKAKVLHDAFRYYQSGFDAINGGLGRAPKFPSSLSVRFLLRYHRRTSNVVALEMATRTLDKMAAGGMYDHVAGGFHRYSTDEKWLVPHFEKMLYDNALLVFSYLEAFQVEKCDNYRGIVEEVLDYIEREMTSPEGGFYSATDADSVAPSGHREEGYFFTWVDKEIDEVLEATEAKILKQYYNTSAKGNFEGRNIFHVSDFVSDALDLPAAQFKSVLLRAKAKLLLRRDQRPKPPRDEKIISSWNGLMISAFARAGFAFNNDRYLKCAEKSASFILTNLFDGATLYRSFKNDQRKYRAYLDDYVFMIASFLDLFEATQEINWLERAISFDRILEQQFEDRENGGFFFTSLNHEKLLVREKPSHDGAEPCGNSVAAMNLFRLYLLTSDISYRERAENVFKSFGQILSTRPAALAEMLLAIDFYLDESKEIVLCDSGGSVSTDNIFLDELRQRFVPNKVVVMSRHNGCIIEGKGILKIANGKPLLSDASTAYVCKEGSCAAPTNDLGEFIKLIEKSKRLE